MSTINDQINDEEMERRMRTMEPAEEAIQFIEEGGLAQPELEAAAQKMAANAMNYGRGISKTELIKDYLRVLGYDIGEVFDNYVQQIKPKPPKEKTEEDYIRLHEAAHKRTLKNLRRAAQWRGKR